MRNSRVGVDNLSMLLTAQSFEGAAGRDTERDPGGGEPEDESEERRWRKEIYLKPTEANLRETRRGEVLPTSDWRTGRSFRTRTSPCTERGIVFRGPPTLLLALSFVCYLLSVRPRDSSHFLRGDRLNNILSLIKKRPTRQSLHS